MEYSVTLENGVTPTPIDKYPSVNKFVWDTSQLRRGMLHGLHVEILFPAGGPLTVVSLQRTCRQFYHELEGVFYRVNTFKFLGTAQCERYLTAITVEKRRQIRKVFLAFPRACLIKWARAPNFAAEELQTKLGPLPKVLSANCPLLERFIITLVDRPLLYEVMWEGNLTRRYSERSDAYPYCSFAHRHAGLRYHNADRNPTRTLKDVTPYVSIIGRLLALDKFRSSDLAIPQLEFIVAGSPSVIARGTLPPDSPSPVS